MVWGDGRAILGFVQQYHPAHDKRPMWSYNSDPIQWSRIYRKARQHFQAELDMWYDGRFPLEMSNTVYENYHNW